MIRVCKMSGKFYGIELPEYDDRKAMEEITGFVKDGTPVIIAESLDDLEDLGIYDVIMVERDD